MDGNGHLGRPDEHLGPSARDAMERSFADGLERSSVAVVAVATDGLVLRANPAFAALVRRPAAELRGANLSTLVQPLDAADAGAATDGLPHQLPAGLDLKRTECRYLRPDGAPGRVNAMTSVVRGAAREPLYLLVTLEDVTEEREQAQEHAAHTMLLERIARRERLEHVLEGLCRSIEDRAPGTHCTVLLLNHDGRTIRHGAAPSLPEAFRRAIDGTPIGPEGGSGGAAMFGRQEVVARDIATHPYWRQWRDIALPLGLRSCWSTPLLSTDGRRVLGSFAVYWEEPHTPTPHERRLVRRAADITAIAIERQLTERALARASLTDPLTGLANRTHFLAQLTEALHRARPDRPSVAVLYLDLDAFKLVNDSMGHDVGNQLLRGVANRLVGAMRPGDTAARIGADEFAVLCEDVADVDVAQVLAEKVRGSLARPFRVSDREVFATASVGVSVGSSAASADRLMENADAAMYLAKGRGRARVELYDDQLRERASSRLGVETALRHALDRDEFTVHYQPVIEIETGRLTAFEALLRWAPADIDPIGPADFIPVAEATGLIGPIGHWVLNEACRQHAAWRTEHGAAPVVAVNVSPRQLAEPGFVDTLRAALAEHGLPVGALRFELTETALADPLTDHDVLTEMTRMGAQLSVDDFGTGHSSLARLRSLAVNELKIDRSFVDGLGTEPGDSAVVLAILRMAGALGLEVVAEGVETRTQLEELRRLGCRLVQGYLFARPAGPGSFSGMMTGHLWRPGS